MPAVDFLPLLPASVTAIGVCVAAHQLRINRRHAVTTFEDSVTAQYRQIASSLPLKALLGEPLTNGEHKVHLKFFYRYFDLCNEQAFLHQGGRMSESTWAFWKDGIVGNLRRPAFEKAWQEIAGRAKDDFSELKKLCSVKARAVD